MMIKNIIFICCWRALDYRDRVIKRLMQQEVNLQVAWVICTHEFPYSGVPQIRVPNIQTTRNLTSTKNLNFCNDLMLLSNLLCTIIRTTVFSDVMGADFLTNKSRAHILPNLLLPCIRTLRVRYYATPPRLANKIYNKSQKSDVLIPTQYRVGGEVRNEFAMVKLVEKNGKWEKIETKIIPHESMCVQHHNWS
jgi:hypothetical protein